MDIEDQEIDALLDEMSQDFNDAVSGAPLNKDEPTSGFTIDKGVVTPDTAEPQPAQAAEAPAAEPQPAPAAKPQPAPAAEAPAVSPAAEIADKGEQSADMKVLLDKISKLEEQLKEKPAAEADEPAASQPQDQSETGEPAAEQIIDPAEQLSESEVELLAAYEEDNSDIAQAEAIHRKVLAGRIGIMMNELYKAVQSQLGDLTNKIDKLSENSLEAIMRNEFQEYDALKKNISDWITTQPGFLQNAYNEVLNSNDPGAMKDLVALYQTSTNSAPAPASAPVSEQPDTETHMAELAGMSPVVTRATQLPPNEPDPNDVVGAFEEALKKYGS